MDDRDEGGDYDGGGRIVTREGMEEEKGRKYYKLNVHPPEFYPEDLIIR